MRKLSIGLRLTLWYLAIFLLAELIFGAGMFGDALGAFQKGLLDEIRIHPRALDASEIEGLFRERGQSVKP